MKWLNPNWHKESFEDVIWSRSEKRLKAALANIDPSVPDEYGRMPIDIAKATRDDPTIEIIEKCATERSLRSIAGNLPGGKKPPI